MEVLLLAVIGAVNIACFVIGAKVGQAVAKGEKVEAPTLSPVKAIREHKERKEAEYEQDRLDIILQNMERYNGTEQGQQEVPRG